MSTTDPTTDSVGFADLDLPASLLDALGAVGYETPSPIQAQTIPALLAGRDLVGQAQTGTGKTAAFALPILAKIDLQNFGPQALVLTPTRELAIQVSEAFQKYAAKLRGFHVLPIYGGQGYGPQLSGLRRGAHVVVGTPGRVIDHLERGTLDLSQLRTLVLDEGDEMLRMGFIEDVEAVLAKAPEQRQVALFSATMPPQMRRIAKNHLTNPAQITIRAKTSTAENTRQRYLAISHFHKLDALTRILEVEPFDAMIIFARTKIATEDLAQKLEARGFAAAALNGDIAQAQRERTVERLKKGRLDILVATDVAARGLDVDRISHVLNYDIPVDIESYVHRIGRTGRAGRSGEAILFVTHRERHLLKAIERATRQRLERMFPPTDSDISEQRVSRFKERITEALADEQIEAHRQLLEQYAEENDVPPIEIAAALATLAQGKTPLFDLPDDESDARPKAAAGPEPRAAKPRRDERTRNDGHPNDRSPRERPRNDRPHDDRPQRSARPQTGLSRAFEDRPPREQAPMGGLVRYRIEVGRDHGAGVGNIVGAIANEAGLDSKDIGRIHMRDDHSFVDLPAGMPRPLLNHLKKVWISGQQLKMALADTDPRDSRVDTPFRDRPQPRGTEGPKRKSKLGLAARKPKHRKNIGKPKGSKAARAKTR